MLVQSAPASTPQERVIRVFVSSTFREIQAEREELVTRIVPQFGNCFRSRGVTWGEVEPAWGITGKQNSRRTALPFAWTRFPPLPA